MMSLYKMHAPSVKTSINLSVTDSHHCAFIKGTDNFLSLYPYFVINV